MIEATEQRDAQLLIYAAERRCRLLDSLLRIDLVIPTSAKHVPCS